MKIVVLDAHAVEQDDLCFENELKKIGDVTVYQRTKANEAIKKIGDADIVFTNKVLMTDEIFEKCKNLKYVGVLATGYNIVDIESAKKHNIVVTNIPAYSTDSVVQHTFALIFELCSQIGNHDKSVHNGDWVSSEDFCYSVCPITELSGKTLGIVGYGNIGKAVEKVAKAFGMEVVKYNRTHTKETISIEEVFLKSDIVSLHMALSPENEKRVGRRLIGLMKQNAFLINTARGGLIDEQALANALNAGEIRGAGLDVLSVEPPKPDNPLLSAKNCIIVPHIAWMSVEARTRLFNISIDNLKSFLNNNPQNTIF